MNVSTHSSPTEGRQESSTSLHMKLQNTQAALKKALKERDAARRALQVLAAGYQTLFSEQDAQSDQNALEDLLKWSTNVQRFEDELQEKTTEPHTHPARLDHQVHNNVDRSAGSIAEPTLTQTASGKPIKRYFNDPKKIYQVESRPPTETRVPRESFSNAILTRRSLVDYSDLDAICPKVNNSDLEGLIVSSEKDRFKGNETSSDVLHDGKRPHRQHHEAIW